MPEPADLGTPHRRLDVHSRDAARVELWIRDAGGEATLPIRRRSSRMPLIGKWKTYLTYVTVMNVPEVALSVMATRASTGRGFTVVVPNDSSVTSFAALTLP